MNKEKDRVSLKWGTLKSWKFVSKQAMAMAEDVDSRGLSWSMGAASQVMTDAHKKAVCDLIDAANCEHVLNEWSGDEMTKEEAKAYVMGYGR